MEIIKTVEDLQGTDRRSGWSIRGFSGSCKQQRARLLTRSATTALDRSTQGGAKSFHFRGTGGIAAG
jgi:hypothetical protein